MKSEESEKQKTILFLKDIYSNTQFSFRLFDERYYFEEFDAGRNSYIKRNEKIIKDSDFLVFYYDPYNRTHGTRLMFDFANKKHKNVFNIFDKK